MWKEPAVAGVLSMHQSRRP
ncbi:hypothetical protein QQP08_024480 [Theobroma cacao]|nr:hypothetical protein QQP08_024480 [Theobroma cacao]